MMAPAPKLSERFSMLSRPLFQLIVAGGAGLLLGAISLWGSPLWALIALAGIGAVVASAVRPELALLALMVVTSSIVFDDVLPLIPIGIGSLHIPDLILLGLIALIAYRWIVEPDFRFIRTPLDWPIVAFGAIAVLSTMVAVLRGAVALEEARRELRYFAPFLVFFAVTNLVRERRQLLLLLRGTMLLGTVVAVAMVVQFLLGQAQVLVAGFVYSLAQTGSQLSDVTRIIPPGVSLLFVGFIVTAIQLAQSDAGGMLAAHWGLLGLALILTFLRSYWVAAALVLLLALLILGTHQRLRLAGWSAVLALLAIGALGLAFATGIPRVQQLGAAVLERAGTLGEAGVLASDSLKWRYVENEEALTQIRARPLLGLGIGARYRPYHPMLDQSDDWDARRFIHNGHLWILVKTGALGYLSLVWLSLTFLIRGFKYWRAVPDPEIRGAVLAFTLAYIGLLTAAVANSIFGSWSWTPVVGVMMGINEVVWRRVAVHA